MKKIDHLSSFCYPIELMDLYVRILLKRGSQARKNIPSVMQMEKSKSRS